MKNREKISQKTLKVPAKIEKWNNVNDFLELQLEEAGCSFIAQTQILIAAEEIFVNIASYALLLMMVAQVTGLKAGDFVHTIGDTHLYLNHLEQVDLQLTREPRPLPKMKINPDVKDIFDFKYEDFELVDYDPHPHIKGVVAV